MALIYYTMPGFPVKMTQHAISQFIGNLLDLLWELTTMFLLLYWPSHLSPFSFFFFFFCQFFCEISVHVLNRSFVFFNQIIINSIVIISGFVILVTHIEWKIYKKKRVNVKIEQRYLLFKFIFLLFKMYDRLEGGGNIRDYFWNFIIWRLV